MQDRSLTNYSSSTGPATFASPAIPARLRAENVAPHADFGTVSEELLLLLADAQTSGGLLLAGEIPGAPVIGHLIERAGPAIIVR